MKILAWDTSSKVGALVALEWDPKVAVNYQTIRLVSEWTLNVDSTHSERLLWGIHELLESARWRLEDVDLFGVGIGPGSFTGLRIGITTARTLAHTLDKPLIGVSSLAVLARPAAMYLLQTKTILVAVTDACKGEVFALLGNPKLAAQCAVKPNGGLNGIWKRGVEEQVLSPTKLIQHIKLKLKNTTNWLAVGEGRQRYLETWNLLPQKKEIKAPFLFSDHIQGRYLGLVVCEAYQAGLATKALDVHPRYLRAPDAEIKLKAGLLS